MEENLFGIPSAIGAIGGLIQGGINLAHQKKAFEKQHQLNREIFDFNKAQADRTYEWNKYVQENTWNREDNAVQRKVADLEAAGLNKLGATNEGAQAGQVVAQAGHSQGGLQEGIAPTLNTGIQESMANLYNAIKMKQDISQSKAQELLIFQDILKRQQDTALTKEEQEKVRQEWKTLEYNLRKSMDYGLRTTDQMMKELNTLKGVINEFLTPHTEEQVKEYEKSQKEYKERRTQKDTQGKNHYWYGTENGYIPY